MASDFDPGKTGSILGDDIDALSDKNIIATLLLYGPENTFAALVEMTSDESVAVDKLHYAACKILYDSDQVEESTDIDVVLQPGTECLIWLAQKFPDLDEAMGAGSEGSSFSRTPEGRTRMVGHNLLCVAVEHIRSSLGHSNFESLEELVEAIERVAAYIDESDFPVLYGSYIAEFGPIAVDIAEVNGGTSLDNPFGPDANRSNLDDLLGRIADPFLDTPLELQDAARSNISSGSIEANIADGKNYDFALIRCIETSDTNKLALLLHVGVTDMKTIGYNVWDTVSQLIAHEDKYGAEVLDIIYQNRPGYFSRFANLEDDSGDIFYGRKVGEAVGMAGHADAIRDLVNPESKQDNMISTVAGIVTGLGMTSNYIGLALLESRLTHWSTELRDQVKQCFEDGQKKAGRPISFSDLEDKTV